MRQTLLFGGLESIRRNVNRKAHNLKFFEVGNTYTYNQEKWTEDSPIKAYTQSYHMALWITGKRVEGSWAHPNEDATFYELKAHVENILRRLGVAQGMILSEPSENNIFDKALALKNRARKVVVEMGILSYKLLKKLGIEQPVYYAELDWGGLMKLIRKNKLEFEEISKYPSVSRDLALLIDANIEFAQVEKIAFQSEKKLLKKVELFDVYEA